MTKVVWLMKRSAGAEIDPADLEELLDVMKIGKDTQTPSHQHYRIFVTKTRLQGYCRMLIFEAHYQSGAEYFGLRFDTEGIFDHQFFADANEEEIGQFLQREPYEEIAYEQGITLLRDALLQNYRYGTHIDLLSAIESRHMAGAVYYDGANRPDMSFYVQDMERMVAAECYLEACASSDAGLTYDLLAPSQRRTLNSRESYCHVWNHELQSCRILRVNWHQIAPDKPELLTGQMLLLSPSEKLLETQVYFEFAEEAGVWWIKTADVNVLKTLSDRSELNPLDDRVFVSVIEGAVEEVCQVLEGLRNVEITGETDDQTYYKWFKQETSEKGSIDILDIYLAQIIAQKDQIIFYSKHLDELNRVIEQLLELVSQPLMIKAKGTDTIENIYRTVKLERKVYEMTPKDSDFYHFEGDDAKRIAAHCFRLLPEKWHYYKRGSFSINETVRQGLVEVQVFPEAVAVHFYNITPDEIISETEAGCCRWLAEVSREKGLQTTSFVRSAHIYHPFLCSPLEAEKRWRFECEQIRSKKIKYL